MANPNDPIARYTESFLYLQNALEKVAGVIQESIDVLGDSQKVSNALGRTFSLTSGELVPVMSKLEGTISQRLSVAFEALKQGVDLNATGALKLAEQQKITGQDYKASLRLFQQVQKSLDFSVEETDRLAETLTESSKTYGVSTEFLTASIEKLIQSNEDFLILNDLGPQFTEAAAMMSAKIGPGLDKDLARVTNLLYTFGSENEAILANLGATSIREQLANNKLTAEQRVALEEEFIKTASARISQIAGSSSKSLVAQGDAVKALFGGFAGTIQKLDQQLSKTSERTPEQTFTDITQSILKIFDPIKESFLNFVSTNEETINKLIDGATNFVKGILNIFGPAETIIGSFILAITSAIPIIKFAFTAISVPFLKVAAIVGIVVSVFSGLVKAISDNTQAFMPLFNYLKQFGLFIFNIIKLVGSFLFKVGEILGLVIGKILEIINPLIGAFGLLFKKINDYLGDIFEGDAENRKKEQEDSNNLKKIANATEGMDQRGRDALSQEKAVDSTGSIEEIRNKIASKYKTLDTYLEAGAKLEAIKNENLQKTTTVQYGSSYGRMVESLRTSQIISDVRISDLSPEAAKAIANSIDMETLGEIFIRASDENGRVVADAVNREIERTGFRF